jgi:uncharacterized protein YndB with AHSA1/START domain
MSTFDPDRGFTLTRTFDAPRDKVWRTLSEPDLFARWFGAEADVEITSWDLRPGGGWTAVMTYEGTEIAWAGRFVEVDAPHRIAIRITDEGEIKDTDDVLTLELSEAGDRTVLEFRQAGGGLTDKQYLEAKKGSQSFLDAMEKVVATL